MIDRFLDLNVAPLRRFLLAISKFVLRNLTISELGMLILVVKRLDFLAFGVILLAKRFLEVE